MKTAVIRNRQNPATQQSQTRENDLYEQVGQRKGETGNLRAVGRPDLFCLVLIGPFTELVHHGPLWLELVQASRVSQLLASPPMYGKLFSRLLDLLPGEFSL